MAGIAITTAQEVNNLAGNLVLNFLQLNKQIHQFKASLDVTDLSAPPFSMDANDSSKILKAFELLDNAVTSVERETDFPTLQNLTNFRTF